MKRKLSILLVITLILTLAFSMPASADATCSPSNTLTVNDTCSPVTGTLQIVKVIDQESVADYQNERFIIHVQLKLENFHFSYLLPTITKSEGASAEYKGSGLYRLNLAGGEYVLFNAVPVGTTYIVTEPEEYLPENWSTASIKSDDQHGDPDNIDACGDRDTVTVTNRYTGTTDPEPETGTLKVKKTVDVSGAPDRAFKIFVEFYGLEGAEIKTPEGVEPDEGSAYSYTLSLHDGEEAEFADIPFGTRYSVTEEDLTHPWSHVSGGVSSESETCISSLLTEVVIKNHYTSYTPDPDPGPYPDPGPTQQPQPAAETGSLTVSKNVTGSNASAAEKFLITVSFTPSGSASITDIKAPAGAEGGNGTYTLSLSANDGPVTFTNIPLNTSYTVTETLTAGQSDAGWVKGGDLAGLITKAGESAVLTNTNNAQVLDARDDDSGQAASELKLLPQTGGISVRTLIGLFGLMLITLGGTAVVLLRKKNSGKSL